MTDKHIIIDGVDVSGFDELVNGCDCYLTEEHDYRATNPYSYDKCSGFPNCYYKQLARKTQECEELREDRERWKSNFNGKVSAIEELLQQLDQLKAEKAKLEAQIEEDTQYHVKEECNLRKIIRNKEKRNVELYKENNQLEASKEQAEQKLKQIKDICKSYCELMCLGEDKEICKSCPNTEILEIIDEVE